MRAAPLPSREPSSAGRAAGGRAHRPVRGGGLASVASAVGNRAFAQHVARCGGQQANHDSGRDWTDSLLELGAATTFGLPGALWAGWHYADSGGGGGGSGSGSGSAAPACSAANSKKKAKVSIQPVVIADDDGKNPTSAPSMAKVTEIWKKCCIDVSVAATKTIKKSDYKTLDESPNDTPTAEETKMFADGGTFDGVQVYVPAEFAMGGKTGKDLNGGGATYDAAKEHPKIVVVEGTVSEVVAHELGHATGHLTHDTSDTVMKPTGKHDTANKSAVSSGVCTSARTGKVLTTSTDDCCMDPK